MESGSVDLGGADEYDTALLKEPVWFPTVRLGGTWENTAQLASNFLTSARQLAMNWAYGKSRRDDGLVLPMLYMFRHAIELGLKSLCIDAQKAVILGASMGIGEDTTPAKFDQKLKTHSLDSLTRLFNQLVAGFEAGSRQEIPKEISEALSRLHNIDTKGDYYRYSVTWDQTSDSWKPLRGELTDVNIQDEVNRLDYTVSMLINGAGSWLEDYRGYLNDMWSEYQDIMGDHIDDY